MGPSAAQRSMSRACLAAYAGCPAGLGALLPTPCCWRGGRTGIPSARPWPARTAGTAYWPQGRALHSTHRVFTGDGVKGGDRASVEDHVPRPEYAHAPPHRRLALGRRRACCRREGDSGGKGGQRSLLPLAAAPSQDPAASAALPGSGRVEATAGPPTPPVPHPARPLRPRALGHSRPAAQPSPPFCTPGQAALAPRASLCQARLSRSSASHSSSPSSYSTKCRPLRLS